MNHRPRRSGSGPGGLRRRILLWLLVLSLVPLFVSNTTGYLVTRRIIERQSRNYLMALAGVQAQLIAGAVERHQLYLDVLASDTTLAIQPQGAPAEAATRRSPESVHPRLHDRLASALAALPSLSDLLLLDDAGRVVASTDLTLVGTDMAATEIFHVGREGRYFAKSWGGGLISGPVYVLATPVRGSSTGRTVGVLVGVVGLAGETDFFHIPPHLARDVHIYVLDESGIPIIVPHPHESFTFDSPFPSPLTQRPPGSTADYTNYEGVDVIATSVAVPGLPWLYIAELPASSAFGQLHGLALLAAALEVVFALLLVTVVWMVARSIVDPVRRLVDAAERIRSGKLGVVVGIDRDDELGELGRTFDEMSTGLQQSAQKIEELHHQEMRRAAQLASVGEMAAGIAHEIKNPLVGMVKGMDLLAGRVEKDPKTEELLDQIRAQLQRIESAIRSLLSYARPKEPKLIAAESRDLLQRVVALVGPQADAAGVHIDADASDATGVVRVDPDLMTQALVNLSLNGIQAMGPGGVLTLATEIAPGEVRISVSDTGQGLQADQLETIFRPFYTTKNQGTGLGLAISRGIAERHGGRLDVASEPGRGATFTLVLPAVDSEGE